jgi:Fe-S cluster assembly protein SufD
MVSRQMKRPAGATDRYVAQYDAFAANGARGAPPWLQEIRAAAVARFAELGFPTTRQEDWRFTSVAAIAETPFAVPARRAGPAAKRVAPLFLPVESACRLVFVNGRYAEALSSAYGLPRGVRAGSLAAALEAEPQLLEQHLARHAAYATNAFGALNTAFIRDGAFVHVAEGVDLDAPLQLLFLSTPGAKPTVAHPRNLVVVERGARASVIESYAALGDGIYWTNAVTEVVVGEGAHLELVRPQREAAGAYHVATTHTHQGRDSVLRFHPIVLGAALARHDIVSVLDGPGAELVLNGLYLQDGTRHADHHTVIEHAKPDCQSHEYFNGILDDAGRGVFNGRIVVRPGAQRTDSKQTNHNLVLSEQARADSQPQLEIYADDVKCTHGATLGPLDAKELFYLQSRGLDAAQARGLLLYGFGAEILGRMRHPGVRDALDRLVHEALQPSLNPGATL